jgi:hypothetical protein
MRLEFRTEKIVISISHSNMKMTIKKSFSMQHILMSKG